MSELVRRDGVYDIYGTDERGLYFLVPDGLDTSLSLGELPSPRQTAEKDCARMMPPSERPSHDTPRC